MKYFPFFYNHFIVSRSYSLWLVESTNKNGKNNFVKEMVHKSVLMRIPDYQNVHGVKDANNWTTKINRVNKAHEDEFEKELEDSIHKIKSKNRIKPKIFPLSALSKIKIF